MTYDYARERYEAEKYPQDTTWGEQGWARLMAALAEEEEEEGDDES